MSSVDNQLTKMLSAYKKDMLVKLKEVVIDTAKELEESSTRDAPHFITTDTRAAEGMKGYSLEVGVFGDNDLAAYWEFGTGLSARQILAPYPQYVKDLAWTFKKEVDGTLIGQPYLFNNWLRLHPLFLQQLSKLLKKQH
jgi:hypothetical protein